MFVGMASPCDTDFGLGVGRLFVSNCFTVTGNVAHPNGSDFVIGFESRCMDGIVVGIVTSCDSVFGLVSVPLSSSVESGGNPSPVVIDGAIGCSSRCSDGIGLGITWAVMFDLGICGSALPSSV